MKRRNAGGRRHELSTQYLVHCTPSAVMRPNPSLVLVLSVAMVARASQLGNCRLRLALLCFALTGLAHPLIADTFILEHGGQIEGQWLNREEQPLTKYEVRRDGITLTLPLAQVKEAIVQPPAELEYARRAPTAA